MSNNHIKKIDSIISDLQSLKEDLEGENNTEYEFWNVQAVQSGEREITVYWETYYNGIVDIQFYSAGESVWKHSAKRYGNRIHSSEEEFKVQFNEGIEYGTRYFRVVTDELPVNVESEVFSCELKKKSEFYLNDVQISPKPIHIEPTKDPLGAITGVIKVGEKYRIYVTRREYDTEIFFESTDLENWSNPKKSDVPSNMYMFQHKEEVFGYFEKNKGEIHLYKDFNGKKFNTHIGKAYSWKIDGAISMHFSESGHFRSFGRVRGNNIPVDEGGWGGNVPPYPEPPFDDRRGVSYHANDTFSNNWKKNRQLADPSDFFPGYKKKNEDFVPDFYAPNVMADNRAFLTVFWKQKSRKADRRVSDPDIPENRRYRLTGEVYSIPAIYEDGKMRIVSQESIVPKEFHLRKALPEVHWVTVDPDLIEIGELYMSPYAIEKSGFVYMFYKYRDGHHYEGHDLYPSGIFSYRMKKSDYENLWK